MIAVIDYDAGNLKSVEKALTFLGQQVAVSRDKDTILNADKVILPGVGAFGDAMGKLEDITDKRHSFFCNSRKNKLAYFAFRKHLAADWVYHFN